MKFLDFYKRVSDDSVEMFEKIEREAEEKKAEVFEAFKDSINEKVKDLSFDECIAAVKEVDREADKAFILGCYHHTHANTPEGVTALVYAYKVFDGKIPSLIISFSD